MRLLSWVMILSLLAVPSAPHGVGTLQGTILVSGRPMAGVALAFLELQSGAVVRTRSDGSGAYSLKLPAGRYVVTSEGSPLVVSRAPAQIEVEPARVATANVELMALAAAVQEVPPPSASQPTSGTVIKHDPVCCFVEGRFPLIDAVIEPAGTVARARAYFRAATSEAWYFVEMTPVEGRFEAKLPPPKIAASPVKYYIEAVTTDFGEARTNEFEVVVHEEATSCPENCRIAPIGPPGAVTVFSAATGTAVAPVGFAAGGLALTAGTLAAVAGGAAAAGITSAVTVFNPEPTPAPTPTPAGGGSPEPPVVIRPSPSPSPSPEPSPSPIPTPTPATTFR